VTVNRLKTWETLFRHALDVIDQLPSDGEAKNHWTFGGGTVLMRKHQHRFSKDIDIFVPDPQYLGYIHPQRNDRTASMITDYVDAPGSLKLYFPEGEIDFVAAGALVAHSYDVERIFDRDVRVETTAEIIGKKLKYRCRDFKARDLFDLSLAAEREPKALEEITSVIVESAPFVSERMQAHERQLREDFAAIDAMSYNPTYDQCIARVRALFASAAIPPPGSGFHTLTHRRP